MFIPRSIEKRIRELSASFPVLSVTGPRQSGKTTMLKRMFPDYQYVSLENPDYYDLALNDPRLFLERFDRYAIFDEAQRVPHLFNYLQGKVDNDRIMGQYILSGSQNYLLMNSITQSLAGRVALFSLFPFSMAEVEAVDMLSTSLEEAVFKGFYPPLYDRPLNPPDFFANYIETYVQRDIRQLQAVQNLIVFRTFVQLCAGRMGQPLNYQALATDAGVSPSTAKAWLGILEASHIIFTLPPYFKNFRKRLTKAHKLYFYDVGLAAYLLGIRQVSDLQAHFARGNLFENMVVAELRKQSHHNGLLIDFYYWHESNGHEVDLMWERNNELHIAEVKSGTTLNRSFFDNLSYLKKITGQDLQNAYLIYGGTDSFSQTEAEVLSWRDVGRLLSDR